MAYDFNKSNRLTVNNAISAAFGTGDFSISYLFNTRNIDGSTPGNSQRGSFQLSSATGGLSTSYTTGIVFVFGVRDSSDAQNGGYAVNIGGTWLGSSGGILSTNTNYLACITRSLGVCKLYLNTLLVNTKTISTSLPGTNLCLGGYYDTSFLFDGFIAESAIWNAALTDAEITSLAAGFT
ncbi:MAG: hypothetical protein EBZ77_18105, partial [Chitinophagia bacterium]|nr:hypothetical protein [Chitinophagia bacterium]